MRILYLAGNKGTAKHRADTLVRLGHEIVAIDPDSLVPGGNLAKKFHYESGGIFCEKAIAHLILEKIKGQHFDMTWVGGGKYVGPYLIRILQERFGPVINYNNDDPLGNRDRLSWSLYRKAVPCYDLLVYHRDINVKEAYARGARCALMIYSIIDEVAMAPFPLTEEQRAKWQSEVVFVGTWMPERGPFMAHLVRRGVPLSIYGNRWEKAPEWKVIESAWKGEGNMDHYEYAQKIMSSKISLGLLSKGNRDLHTRRSIEIPYLGGFFCAERTVDHLNLYEEGKEAVFWSDAEECANICREMLADSKRREQIALQGRERCLKNNNFNGPAMKNLLEIVMKK